MNFTLFLRFGTPPTTIATTPATLLMPGFLFSGIVIWGCDDPGDAISRGNGPEVSGPASGLFRCSEGTKPEYTKEDRIQHGQVKMPPFQRVHARGLKPEQQDGLDQEMPGQRDAADPSYEGSPAGNQHGSARCLNPVDAGLQTVRILDNPGQHGGAIKFFLIIGVEMVNQLSGGSDGINRVVDCLGGCQRTADKPPRPDRIPGRPMGFLLFEVGWGRLNSLNPPGLKTSSDASSFSIATGQKRL